MEKAEGHQVKEWVLESWREAGVEQERSWREWSRVVRMHEESGGCVC